MRLLTLTALTYLARLASTLYVFDKSVVAGHYCDNQKLIRHRAVWRAHPLRWSRAHRPKVSSSCLALGAGPGLYNKVSTTPSVFCKRFGIHTSDMVGATLAQMAESSSSCASSLVTQATSPWTVGAPLTYLSGM